ncbi:hypothetical protein [Actinophytocola sp.]|uniref:hypothetical protein n=1 Tax=Actinophytocola sp. TaxID=1872138 RepID=UPI00389AD9C8
MRTDMHPADDVVEIALGEARFGNSALRLVFDDPDTCLRLTEALHDASNRLTAHLHAKRHPGPALSHMDMLV